MATFKIKKNDLGQFKVYTSICNYPEFVFKTFKSVEEAEADIENVLKRENWKTIKIIEG